MFLNVVIQSRLNHEQSIEWRIFISRRVETNELDKNANKMFENGWFNPFFYLEGGKLFLSFLLAAISEKNVCVQAIAYESYAITKQEAAILSPISGNVKGRGKMTKNNTATQLSSIQQGSVLPIGARHTFAASSQKIYVFWQVNC